MTNLSGPAQETCLLNADAKCDRIWVSRSEGLRLSHFQSLEQKEPILKHAGATAGVEDSTLIESAAYEQCVRGCVGPKL
jgi:hypothetical protein